MVYYELEHVVGYRYLAPHTNPGPSANRLLDFVDRLASSRERKKCDFSIMFKLLHPVWLPADLVVGLAVTVAWIGLLGYGVYRLSLVF